MELKSDQYVNSYPWETIDANLRRWLEEDISRGDVTSYNLPLRNVETSAGLIARTDGVLAGGGGFERVFHLMDSSIFFSKRSDDGCKYSAGEELFALSGNAQSILIAERTALNLVTHLSGIATLTARFVEKVKGTGVKITDTRKTLPGLRVLQKYAVRCGGGVNHRMDLAAAVLIKDNHLTLVGKELSDVVADLREKIGHTVKIEVETETVGQVEDAIESGADIIMLDNMDFETARESVKLAKGKAILEVSGGVNLNNVREWAETGVDVISIGMLTHSAPVADMSLEFGR